jgi:hypothetical protein
MKTLLRSILCAGAAFTLAGCSNLNSVGVSGGHNAQTGAITGTVEITFKDSMGNTIVRRYPRSHPAVQHLIANP